MRDLYAVHTDTQNRLEWFEGPLTPAEASSRKWRHDDNSRRGLVRGRLVIVRGMAAVERFEDSPTIRGKS